MLKRMFTMVVAMIFATNVVAEDSIDRTQPYQMMTQVSEVAFNPFEGGAREHQTRPLSC